MKLIGVDIGGTFTDVVFADNAEQDVMPSEGQEPADLRGLRADLLGIKSGRYLPRSKVIKLSCTPGKLPDRIDGGVLASRTSSFSAGLARRYTSVVLRSA